MEKLIGFVIFSAAIMAIILGVHWCLWELWCFVVPKLWATGPDGFTHPDFWLFVAAWFLLSLIGKAIFRRRE